MPPKLFTWDDMCYWSSGEWQVVQEKLDDMDARVELYNPRRELMFAALDATPFDKVKVAIIGQDPYPDRGMACGLAFSISNGTIPSGRNLPPTLENIYKEYDNDLHHGVPKGTDLLSWAHRGVLLWNAIPTCASGRSLSHDWPEYEPLTTEIIERLDDRGGCVFVFMGGVARRYEPCVIDTDKNKVLCTSHPVPRASLRSFNPFTGSRIFTKVNAALHSINQNPIDWKLIH